MTATRSASGGADASSPGRAARRGDRGIRRRGRLAGRLSHDADGIVPRTRQLTGFAGATGCRAATATPETLQTTPSLSLLASESTSVWSACRRRVECTTPGLDQAGAVGARALGRQWLFQRIAAHVAHRRRALSGCRCAGRIRRRRWCSRSSTQDTQTTLNDLGLVLLFVGAGRIIIAAVAGLLVARAGLRPVERLTQAAERVGRTGDLTPIEVESADELGRLARSFNEMLSAVATFAGSCSDNWLPTPDTNCARR